MRLTLSPLALALAATLSLGACSPARGRAVLDEREYQLRMRSRQAGSRRASRRVSSAAATYSHSDHVGRRAPCDWQYASAANQLTHTTGCWGWALGPSVCGPPQCDR